MDIGVTAILPQERSQTSFQEREITPLEIQLKNLKLKNLKLKNLKLKNLWIKSVSYTNVSVYTSDTDLGSRRQHSHLTKINIQKSLA